VTIKMNRKPREFTR